MMILMLIKDIKRLDGAADHDANINIRDMKELPVGYIYKYHVPWEDGSSVS